MLVLNISGKEYKVKFGYNCFCDTDLLERTEAMMNLFNENTGMAQIREMFSTLRELFFYGFKKYNPVETEKEVGDLLDEYLEEKGEGEKRGITALIELISEELMKEGFLADLMETVGEAETQAPLNQGK